MREWGVLLLMGGGYAKVVLINYPITQCRLPWVQMLTVVASLIWLLILVPVQMKQARLARAFAGLDVVDEYRQPSRQWLIGGLISTVPLVMAMWFVITKPASGFDESIRSVPPDLCRCDMTISCTLRGQSCVCIGSTVSNSAASKPIVCKDL